MTQAADPFDGLSELQKKWALEQVEFFKALKVSIPYGLIREQALKNFPSDN